MMPEKCCNSVVKNATAGNIIFDWIQIERFFSTSKECNSILRFHSDKNVSLMYNNVTFDKGDAV